jgi:diguanylate cyclase (GGDEF)-like protein/PAS domain S-box-containing protein
MSVKGAAERELDPTPSAEDLPCAIYHARLDGTLLYLNPAARALLGVSSTAGRRLDEFFERPEDAAEWRQALVRDVRIDGWRARMRGDSGRVFWSAHHAALSARDGQRVEAAFVDVSGLVEATQALEYREHQLAEAERVAHLGSWHWDIASDRLVWSAELHRIYGSDPARGPLSFGDFLDAIHTDDRPHVERIIRQALADQKPFHVQERIVRPDGSERILDSRGEARVDERGTTLGMIGTCRDVTDTLMLEAALRESEAHLRLIVTRLPATVWSLDADMRVVSIEGSALQLAGLEPRRAVGMRLHDCLEGAGTAAVVVAAHEEALATGVADFQHECRGHVFHGHVESLRDGTGAPIGLIGAALDITDRRDAEEKARYHAYHDELTALPNRRLLLDRLTLAVARARRHDETIALLLLDLDSFKRINESVGHAAGDVALKVLAKRFRALVREDDTLARVGGDEFAVLLTELSSGADALNVAQKLLDSIEELSEVEGQELHLGASIGVAVYPQHAPDANGLFKSAEQAMRQAKVEGGGNYQLGSGDAVGGALERLSMENGLRHAVERGELRLHYQPVVGIATGLVDGVEALVRWQRGDTLLGPQAFIPLAEHTGLIVPIGEWILRTACEQAKTWRAAGLRVRVAVNLSARQFRQGDLTRVIERCLRDTGLEPAALEVEITESLALQNIDQTAGVLRKVRDMGVGVALDDFGVGYSSLNYLKHLPLTTVKIDRDFVAGIVTDKGDAAIVQSVITLAHALGLRVVAEGVETDEQLALLADLGCEDIQGYLFSRPLPEEDATALLTRNRL